MKPAGHALFLVLFSWTISHSATGSQVTFQKNGYSNILVGISPEVPEQDGRIVIENIKKLFTAASELLFNATHKRAYFKHVNILIPQSWTTIKVDKEATSEIFEDSDIRIDVPSKVYQDTPYTVHTGRCGEPGEYTHITPGFITELEGKTTATYGPPAKVLVHEWAYLRYGVFEEYGYPGDPRYPLFYFKSKYNPDSGETETFIAPNSCADEGLKGYRQDTTTGLTCQLSPETGLPDSNCRFFPYPGDINTPETSLMSYSYLDSVHLFCDEEDHPHNYEAPNKQNLLCPEQSTWTVISNHEDFADGSNPPADSTEDTTPGFTVVQPKNARFVLVLDVSGSMGSCDGRPCMDLIQPKVRLHQAARRWIKYDIRAGSSLGIVQFSSGATILSELVAITNDASRRQLMSKVPNRASGGTSIGNGLRRGLQVLGKSGQNGGIIILLTDGGNTDSPNIQDVMDEVKKQDVRVVSIAFGKQADTAIEQLAANTGGKSYFVETESGVGSLNEAFTGSLTYQPSEVLTERRILLFQEEYRGQFTEAAAVFSVDATTGRELLVQLDYSKCAHITIIKLIRPDGRTVTVDTDCTKNQENVVQYTEPLAEVGDWTWELGLSGDPKQFVVVAVTSRARNNDTSPIYTRCWLSATSSVDTTKTRVSVFADVKQGNDAVIGANVMARIERPEYNNQPYEATEMALLDNGSGADVVRNDGIYSRYFTQYTSQGRYSVKCQVQNDGDAYVNLGFIAARRKRRDVGAVRSQPADPSLPTCCGSVVPQGEKEPSGNFTRHAAGGSFQVINDVTPDSDFFPPVRVTDLQVTAMSAEEESVTLQWTAPGDDLDEGTALGYILKYSADRADLAGNQFDSSVESTVVNDTEVISGSLTPAEAGQMQEVTLKLDSQNNRTTLYFALRAYDEKDHRSEVSNIAGVYLHTVSNTDEGGGMSAGIIALIVISVLLLLAIFGGLAYFAVFSKKK